MLSRENEIAREKLMINRNDNSYLMKKVIHEVI